MQYKEFSMNTAPTHAAVFNKKEKKSPLFIIGRPLEEVFLNLIDAVAA